MISDTLTAHTIGYLKNLGDAQSIQLADELIKDSRFLNRQCSNCKYARNKYGFADESYCVKHKKIKSDSDQQACFSSAKYHGEMTAIMEASAK